MTFYKGFYDESERPDRKDPIAVAGYLFKPVAYKQFVRRWRADVQSRIPGGKPIHMTDLCGGYGAYRVMSIDQRAEIFDAAVTTIHTHMTAGAGVTLFQDEFEAMVAADWPKHFGSNYAAASQLCVP